MNKNVTLIALATIDTIFILLMIHENPATLQAILLGFIIGFINSEVVRYLDL